MLTLHRRLIALRRSAPALAVGAFTLLVAAGDLLLYLREGAGGRFLIALNLGHAPQTARADGAAGGGQIALSTHLDREGEVVGTLIPLRPDEGVVVALAD
jgi:alpha-glucosidase